MLFKSTQSSLLRTDRHYSRVCTPGSAGTAGNSSLHCILHVGCEMLLLASSKDLGA